MKLVTATEMRSLEETANQAGISYEIMMENAGRSVAEVIRARRPALPTRVLVLIGLGNNGGDGLVAARYLHAWGYDVQAYIWRRAEGPDAQLARALAEGVRTIVTHEDADLDYLAEATQRCDVLVDALLGTGASGPLRGGLQDLLARVHASLAQRRAHGAIQPVIQVRPGALPARPLIVAVDLPSGLNADTGDLAQKALSADVTVTFACAKRGHFIFPGASAVGELLISDIGIDTHLPDTIELATLSEVAHLLPARPADGHKGSFGKALVVAGSTLYVGAPCLAAEAAYRSGAGLVTLAVPSAIYAIVATKVTESTFLMLPSDMGAIVPEANQVLATYLPTYDALLVGPGLGTEKITEAFLQGLIGEANHGRKRLGFELAEHPAETHAHLPPLVIDADGLNLLAHLDGWHKLLPPGTLLTPHPGEMSRLMGCSIRDVQADRLGAARSAACEWGCHIVLKGAYTVIASPQGQTTVLPFANPALATAGTGDVLAGTILGLLAQDLSPYEAAICGGYLHGLAGELARQRIGTAGVLASDLLPLLPEALAILHGIQNETHGL